MINSLFNYSKILKNSSGLNSSLRIRVYGKVKYNKRNTLNIYNNLSNTLV